MHDVTVCIGSNTVQRLHNINMAVSHLEKLFGDSPVESSIYECPSHTGNGADYLNMVISGYTDLDYTVFHRRCKTIESDAGRTETSKATGAMPLDIDIVVWDGCIMRPYDYDRPHFQTGFREISHN